MQFDEVRRSVKARTKTRVLLGAISGAVAGDGGLADLENFSASTISIASVPSGPATGLISGALSDYHFTLVVAPTNQGCQPRRLDGRHAAGNVLPHPQLVAMKSERSRNERWRDDKPSFTV